MAHSVPTQLLNRGDGWRVTAAGGRFIIELCTDRRVQACYESWRRMVEHGKCALDLVLLGARETDAAALKARIADFTAGMVAEMPTDSSATTCGCPTRGSRPVSNNASAIGSHNETHPNDERTFSIEVFLPTLAPKGRRPRNAGLDVERNICWYYQHHVKNPRDEFADLVTTYAKEMGHPDTCHSVIRNGLTQAEALLDVIEAHYVILPKNAVILPNNP